jgi:hypothetical protein
MPAKPLLIPRAERAYQRRYSPDCMGEMYRPLAVPHKGAAENLTARHFGTSVR